MVNGGAGRVVCTVPKDKCVSKKGVRRLYLPQCKGCSAGRAETGLDIHCDSHDWAPGALGCPGFQDVYASLSMMSYSGFREGVKVLDCRDLPFAA